MEMNRPRIPVFLAQKLHYSKRNKRQKNERIGRFAERLVFLKFFFQGYGLLESRYQNPFGEIDLIFKRGKSIAFCEVKFRQIKKVGLEALSPKQQKRIHKGAQFYLARNPNYAPYNMRFDYVVIYKWGLTHLKNAW